MKIAKSVVIFGSIITIMGVIFHLQGQSVVGPQSSFMYSNPEWIDYGQKIAIGGIMIILVGIGIFLRKIKR